MKSAVIATGGKQYLVHEGDAIAVELLKTEDKQVTFEVLLLVEGTDVKIGKPFVAGVKVTADVVDADKQADKVTSIRFKAKKRVKKIRGHRQHQTHIKIVTIG
jgi:large subunit ribosomal protein L21